MPQLEERLYSFDAEAEGNSIEIHLSRLRKTTLGAEVIVTERGLGLPVGTGMTRASIRLRSAADLSLALPLVFMIPLSSAGIFYGLGYGLRPLGQLRSHLTGRGAKDLLPFPAKDMATGLRPIAETLNQLLFRLDTAFVAERSTTANAAHELRTQLARALAQVQRRARPPPIPKVHAGRARSRRLRSA